MMNAVVKPYHEMCLNSSELIVPRDTYQRALHPARVARIPKEEFERWYRSQSRHRTAADRERDREIEAQTIFIPEMQNCSVFQEKRSTGFSTVKNTETVSLLSAWPTGGALPKQVLKYGSTANLHIDSKNRSWKRMKNHRWN